MNDGPPIILGERHGWGEAQAFGISPADHCHHVYIIGKTVLASVLDICS
jgi:hypothetical protein